MAGDIQQRFSDTICLAKLKPIAETGVCLSLPLIDEHVMTAEPIEDAATRPTSVTDPSSTAPAIVKHRRRVWLACALHLIAAWVAALLAWIEVESIIATFPAVVVSGLVVVLLAMRRVSWLLLCYGLAGFWSVAVVSLVIAGFDLNPGRAVPTVPVLLSLFALLITGMFGPILRISVSRPEFCVAARPRFQFRVSTLMWAATVVCVLSALGKLVTWRGEMWVFGSGGLALLGISALLAGWYARGRRVEQTTESLVHDDHFVS